MSVRWRDLQSAAAAFQLVRRSGSQLQIQTGGQCQYQYAVRTRTLTSTGDCAQRSDGRVQVPSRANRPRRSVRRAGEVQQ